MILSGRKDNSHPVPDIEVLTVFLICRILSVRNKANSLQALKDRNSGSTNTGGFVNLSTVANRARAFLLFSAVSSEKDGLTFLSFKV